MYKNGHEHKWIVFCFKGKHKKKYTTNVLKVKNYSWNAHDTLQMNTRKDTQ